MLKNIYFHNAKGTYMVKGICSECNKSVYRAHRVGKPPSIVIFQPSYCKKCGSQLSDFTVRH